MQNGTSEYKEFKKLMKNEKQNKKININSKSESWNGVTQTDKEFGWVLDFVKGRSFLQMQDVIKINFNYLKKINPAKFNSIVNYYNEYKHLWGEINFEKGIYELAQNRARALVEHRQDFEWLYNRLGDYRSKRILLNILSYWMTNDDSKISGLGDKYFLQYFDLDLIKIDKDEVFVDVGAYIGDTLIDYVKSFGADGYKTFYCYEIVPKNIELIEKNIKLFNLKNVVIKEMGASDKKGIMFLPENALSSTITLAEAGELEVKTVKLDDDIKERVGFIKMDIEGAEESALLGCQKLIKKYHPKLALAVYHNHKDLWKLAQIINKIDSGYKFYLRYYGGNLVPTEFVLYAI